MYFRLTISIDTKEWKQIEATSESTKRRGHTAVVLGDGMYIFGGGKDNATKFNDIYEFDFGIINNTKLIITTRMKVLIMIF